MSSLQPLSACAPQHVVYQLLLLLGLTPRTSTALPIRSAAESRKLLDRMVLESLEEKGCSSRKKNPTELGDLCQNQTPLRRPEKREEVLKEAPQPTTSAAPPKKHRQAIHTSHSRYPGKLEAVDSGLQPCAPRTPPRSTGPFFLPVSRPRVPARACRVARRFCSNISFPIGVWSPEHVCVCETSRLAALDVYPDHLTPTSPKSECLSTLLVGNTTP